MMNTNYFIYAIIAVGIFTAYMALMNLFRADRVRNQVRRANVAIYSADIVEEAPPPFAVFCEKAVELSGGDVKGQKELTLTLLQAGVQSPHGVAYYMFFVRFMQPIFLLLGGVMFVKTILASQMGLSERLMYFLIAGMLILGGLRGAALYLTNRKQHRQKVLVQTFPEILDLLLICIESGLGLDAALNRTCSEMQSTQPVIISELERTRMELTLLSDRVQALQNLAERAEVLPFRSLVSALIQTEKFGTSLVDTLRVLSDDLRVNRLLNAENRAARIPVLITIPLILCIMPAFVLIILGPPMIRVHEQGGIMGDL